MRVGHTSSTSNHRVCFSCVVKLYNTNHNQSTVLLRLVEVNGNRILVMACMLKFDQNPPKDVQRFLHSNVRHQSRFHCHIVSHTCILRETITSPLFHRRHFHKNNLLLSLTCTCTPVGSTMRKETENKRRNISLHCPPPIRTRSVSTRPLSPIFSLNQSMVLPVTPRSPPPPVLRL